MSVHAVIIYLQRRHMRYPALTLFCGSGVIHPETLVVFIPWLLYRAFREESKLRSGFVT